MRILGRDNRVHATPELLGGKGWNLVRVADAGFSVPPFLVVTTEALASLEPPDIDEADEWSTDLLRLDAPLRAELNEAVAVQFAGVAHLAVRSSALGEDAADLSWAGQFESMLHVPHSNVADAVEKVWHSARSERVRAYLKLNNLPDRPPAIAVVVQAMIDAEISGVAFGIDPTSGNRNAVVISALYGLGEGLVSGGLDADLFTVTGNSISRNMARKQRMIVVDASRGTGTHEVDVAEERQTLPSLDEPGVRRIAEAAGTLTRLFRKPQDIEWSIAGDELYILQSRPITNLAAIPADRSRTRIIWDNSNIIESYPGVTTPLTFSFVEPVYSEVYKELCSILGVDADTIQRNRDVFRMLGMVQGRIYYNLLNWYRVLALLPGYRINAGFMEGMMGVSERLEEHPQVVPSRRNPYVQLARTLYRLLSNLRRLPRLIDEFQEHLDDTLRPFESTDLHGRTPRELHDIYRHLERSLLQRWRVPILNDFYTMIFFGLLKKLIEKWKLDDTGTLQNDLLTGQGGIISAEPPVRLAAIARAIRKHPELMAHVETESPAAFLDRLTEFPAIDKEVRAYLDRFGARYMGELKLETITPAEQPELLVPLLATWLRQEPADEKAPAGDSVRRNAERRARLALRGSFRKGLFNYLLRQTRERVRNRENLRFARTRVYAVVRRIFLATGYDIVASGGLDDERDIMYLTLPEIFAWIDGAAVTADLRPLVRLRRAEFDGYRNATPDDRFETWGEIYQGNSFRSKHTPAGNDDRDSLRGTPCSPGIVRAPARLVVDPTHAGDLSGMILVAERTDPGWAPLFPLVLGIVVERGSPLSHSAIVAREMGVPAIVGVPGLMQQLHDGEMIEMDGSTGTVRRV